MRSIAQILAEDHHPNVIDRLFERQQRDRERRIAEYGFRPECECSWCGDLGMNLEQGSLCLCPAGEAKARQIDLVTNWSHLVPTRFVGYTLEGHPNTGLVDGVAAWLAEDPVTTGLNLVIQGRVGVGKTGVAIGAIRELHMAGRSVAYWSLPNLMDYFRAEERSISTGKDFTAGRKAPMMDQLTRIDCLLLDDLGQERVTDYVAERLYVLIDGRYVAGKPTILTTNLSKTDLETHIGERSASRLREHYLAVRGRGTDLRARDLPGGAS